MADQPSIGRRQRSLHLLILDAFAFWRRNQAAFWIVAVPIAGLDAAIAFILDREHSFTGMRNHWGWNFLFALIYALFLDRWMKIALLEDAWECDEVNDLRRSLVSVRFLAFAAVFAVLGLALSTVRIEGIAATLVRWHFPIQLAAMLGEILSWLPHLLLWTALAAPISLMLPALSASQPTSLVEAWQLGQPVRTTLFRLIVAAGLVSFVVMALAPLGLALLPKRSWAISTMVGLWRLVDCVLLAFVGYILAMVWKRLADWHPPEPEDHPFRNMNFRIRGPVE